MSPNDSSKSDYMNPKLPVAQRLEDLLSQMTLQEKVAQMLCVWQDKAKTLVDEKGDFNLEIAKENFGHGHGLGQVGRPSDAGGGKNARQMAEQIDVGHMVKAGVAMKGESIEARFAGSSI